MHFRGQIWVRVKFEDKNGFKTIILIYPENLGHLDIFSSEKGQGVIVYSRLIFFQRFWYIWTYW